MRTRPPTEISDPSPLAVKSWPFVGYGDYRPCPPGSKLVMGLSLQCWTRKPLPYRPHTADKPQRERLELEGKGEEDNRGRQPERMRLSNGSHRKRGEAPQGFSVFPSLATPTIYEGIEMAGKKANEDEMSNSKP